MRKWVVGDVRTMRVIEVAAPTAYYAIQSAATEFPSEPHFLECAEVEEEHEESSKELVAARLEYRRALGIKGPPPEAKLVTDRTAGRRDAK